MSSRCASRCQQRTGFGEGLAEGIKLINLRKINSIYGTTLTRETMVPGIVVQDGAVQVGTELMTGAIGVFAGGDMIPSQRDVTAAIGLGKKTARNIDAFLRSEKYAPKAKTEIADVKKMNTWYYSDAPRTVRPMLDVVRRTTGFAEVVGNLDEETAVFEARRCMSCGICVSECPCGAIKMVAEEIRAAPLRSG